MADRYFKISDRKTRNRLGKNSLSYVVEFFAVTTRYFHRQIFSVYTNFSQTIKERTKRGIFIVQQSNCLAINRFNAILFGPKTVC